MEYIKDIRKYIGHIPIMCCVAGAIITLEEEVVR